MPISVLLADDHGLVREGLRKLLEIEPDIRVVGEASDGLEALKMVDELAPDVVVMDISMPVADGIAATREIVRRRPETRVIILTMHKEDGHAVRAIQAGARGYLLKNTRATEVLSAIRAVHNGASLVDPIMMTKVLAEFRRIRADSGSQDGLAGLTETELGILRLLAAGASNKEIAQKMGLANSTVKNKLTVLFSKLDVADRTQAAVFALRQGLVIDGG
ncbi:MAG: response regulator transcription factor [Dehalococcoidia bacterium]|nr:response regulator transcription factor [Dehalococcoidia bacterium]